MKKNLLLFFGSLIFVINSAAQTANAGKGNVPQTGKINWTIDPFKHDVFIENAGQFEPLKSGEKIFFEAKLGGEVNASFTAKGVLYAHMETEKLDFSDGKDPDQDGPPKRTYHFLTTSWQGANPNVTITADLNDKLSYYYSYPKGTHDSYFANIYKKITYHNLYPDIDVVYSFPEGSNDLKYTIIVHPGADLSKVHLKYHNSKNLHLDASGNVVDDNNIGTLKETAPVSYYQEDHSPATVSSKLNSSFESYSANNLDATKTLAIDPTILWTTNPFPASTSYDYAYDLDYDNQGNVYAYGGNGGSTSGSDKLELVKLNAAGAIQWTYISTTMTSSTDFYGDAAVDKHSLECYLVEGWNAGGGARVEKLSPAGALMATDPGNSSFNEMWRIQSSICPPGFVVFGNGTCCPYQACMLDTTMTTINPVNILGAGCTTGYHDMALTAVDPFGNFAWTETTHSLVYATWNNHIIKSPIPALSPSAYDVPIHYSFHEIGSIFYAPIYVFNAMNGLVSGRAWLFAFNGDTLKQVSKTTGAIGAVARVSNSAFDWGGLDVDLCDNVYLGDSNTIKVFDGTSLANTSTLPVLPGIIYDLKLGPYVGQLLYACGQNFVSSISLGPPQTIPITITKIPSCGFCHGSATVSATPCGVLDTLNVTYLWSDGETTRTATHLCAGLDSVGVTVICGLTYWDTVTMVIPPGGYNVARDSTEATCAGPGSAAVIVTGGSPPYTYNWSNGSTNSSTGPVSGGVYCVGIKDNTGCYDSVCIDVPSTALPNIVVTPTPDTICDGSQVGLTASGGVSYVWTPPSSGLSCYTCANPSASPTITTTYTITGTDAGGCSNVTTAIVNVIPKPVITVTAASDSICNGLSIALTASGGVSYSWTPSTGLSCNNCSNPTASPTVTTVYNISGTDAQGCVGTTTFTLNVINPPTINVSPNVSICTGQTTVLTATATNNNGIYFWQPGGFNSPSISVSPTSTQTYTVTCSNSCGTAFATVTVSMLATPVPSFNADVLSGCSPMCVQFRNTSTIASGSVAAWGWSFGNNDTVSARSPVYCYSTPGVYSVSLTAISDSGCSASLSISNMVTVYSNPVANFTASPQPTTILQPTIQFTNQSTDTYGALNWSWDFGVGGDSGISRLQNPVHTYSDTGTYCVKLGVINIHGCVDTMTDCIVIDPIYSLYIPNAFTPNGDGVNDLFMAKGNDIKTFEMYIFDRWGEQLFHADDITKGWNGEKNNSGSICQIDAYVYVIKVTDSNNHPHTYTGTVNLIK